MPIFKITIFQNVTRVNNNYSTAIGCLFFFAPLYLRKGWAKISKEHSPWHANSFRLKGQLFTGKPKKSVYYISIISSPIVSVSSPDYTGLQYSNKNWYKHNLWDTYWNILNLDYWKSRQFCYGAATSNI